MKKFWAMKNDSSATADIFIYGDIIGGDKWNESDTTAKSFADDLEACKGKKIIVHLNSGGGSVFDALAIMNTMRQRGNITVSIEGVAASAASLIAMGGSRITMADNALMMTHAPSVGLLGYYDAEELTQIQKQLTAVESSIVQTYSTRVKDAAALVAEETWFNAQEALKLGLIDEITEAVDLKVDDAQKMLFVNSLAISTKKYDAAKMRRAMEAKTMSETVNQASEPVVDVAAIRQQEISRIRELVSLKTGDVTTDALIEVAIGDGRSAAEIQPYLDAVKKVAQPSAAAQITAVIRDQLTSGAEGVAGGQPAPTEDELKAAQAKKIADIANSLM